MIASRHPRSRLTRLVLTGLVLLTPLLAIAAAAWACNPQAHLSLDKTTYEAGSTITATGSYFPANATITVSAPTETTTARTSAGGGFTIQLTAPAAAGDYTITATRPTGGFAPASFAVVAATAKPPATQPSPQETPVLPSPDLAPDVAGPTIDRPTRASEIVFVSRAGSVRLFCGRFHAPGIRGTCGAASTRAPAASASRPLELRPKAFRAHPGRRVHVQYHLTALTLKHLKAARREGMRATVVAADALGNHTTKTFAFTLKPRGAPAARAR